jgi:predicted nucleic acid-binding protein
MVNAVLDSSVLIDVLRNYPQALEWIAGRYADYALTSMVWLEVIQGAPNIQEQQRSIKLLRQFEKLETLTVDFDWAITQLIRFNLRYNVELEDCLIAAPAHRLQIPLYTRNLKHFTPLLGTLAISPY